MKVSVIIPVYNAELYLDECLQSVLNQNFSDFEVLLINDGSKDSSGLICDKYAVQDRRLKVFHKKNGGVSSARNLGIENASGEWIAFVDSDDYLSANYFQPILEYSEEDYIILNSFEIRGSKKTFFRDYEPKRLFLEDFLKEFQLYTDFATPWGKFFKNSLITDNNIRFDEKLTRSEDVIFNLEYIFKCNTVGLSSLSSYNYRRVANSLSHKNVKLKDAKYIYDHIFDLLQAHSSNAEFISRHISYSAMRYFFTVLNSNLKRYEKKAILEQLIKRHKDQLKISVTGQRIHLIPVKWLINFELVNFIISLAQINK